MSMKAMMTSKALRERIAGLDDPIEIESMLTEEIGYQPALGKAVCDLFQYACKLRTGELIEFTEAIPIDSVWVELLITEVVPPQSTQTLRGERWNMTFERNMYVRIADIVWCADAPYGS